MAIYTQDISILVQAGIRVILFVSIAGVITLLAAKVKQSEITHLHLIKYHENIITNALVWLMVLDRKGNIQLWNNAAEEISGYRFEEVIGKNEIWKLLYPEKEYRKQITETITRIISSRNLENFETTVLSKAGDKKIISWNTKGIPDDAGVLSEYIAIGVDVTDRHIAEDALRESNQKLRLLTSLTRHDILNSLNVVQLLQELALDSSDLPTVYDYVNRSHEVGEHIEKIIGFTREYETFGTNSSGWQNINKTIESARNEVTLGDVSFENLIPHNLEIYADPIIRKVFATLMENAVRHGGDISIIRFSGIEVEDTFIIICEDDGVGIPDNEKKHIFDHGFGKHTGIGLFLASEILSITGLSILETGEPGKGARFEILVPKGKFRIFPVNGI